MKYDVLDIANYILKCKNYNINLIELQSILFYLKNKCLTNNIDLFNAKFYIEHGYPKIREVQNYYCMFGFENISKIGSYLDIKTDIDIITQKLINKYINEFSWNSPADLFDKINAIIKDKNVRRKCCISER